MSTADNPTKKSPVSARERARQATTRRLAAEQARFKITAAELKQATALRTIKDRGETVASIAEATDLSAAEVRTLLKRAPAAAPETVSIPNDEPTTTRDDPEDPPQAALTG